jgi:hypothetical protein
MDTSSLRERVEYLLAQVPDLDAKELGLLAGLSSSHVGQIKNGHVRSMLDPTATALARVTGSTRAWLAFGEGEAPLKTAVEAAVEAARALRASAERPSLPDVAA